MKKQYLIFCLLCFPGRSMASVFADTIQPVTTVSTVHLSTMTSPGRLPMASQGHHMSVKVSHVARESNAE